MERVDWRSERARAAAGAAAVNRTALAAAAAAAATLDLFRDQPAGEAAADELAADQAAPRASMVTAVTPPRDPRLPNDPPEIVYSPPYGLQYGETRPRDQHRYVHLYTHVPALSGHADGPVLRFYRAERWDPYRHYPGVWSASVTGRPGKNPARDITVCLRLDAGDPARVEPERFARYTRGGKPANPARPRGDGPHGDRMRWVATLEEFERHVRRALQRWGTHPLVTAALARDVDQSVSTSEWIGPNGGADAVSAARAPIASPPESSASESSASAPDHTTLSLPPVEVPLP